MHLLSGIENGTLSVSIAGGLIDDADPALVYFLFTWLRNRYRNHPAAEGVIGRLVELTKTRSVNAKVLEGKQDSIVKWFESEHDYSDFNADEFVELIVEKLEG